MSSALDRVRSRKKRASTRVPVCMDASLTAEVDRLDKELTEARVKTVVPGMRNDDALAARIVGLEIALEEAKAAVAAEVEWFLVEALPQPDYDALIAEHPPTAKQSAEARKEHGPKASLAFNTETFPAALIAACTSVITSEGEDPETGKPVESFEHLTPEFVDEMRTGGNWSTGELNELFEAAGKVNASRASITSAGNG